MSVNNDKQPKLSYENQKAISLPALSDVLQSQADFLKTRDIAKEIFQDNRVFAYNKESKELTLLRPEQITSYHETRWLTLEGITSSIQKMVNIKSDLLTRNLTYIHYKASNEKSLPSLPNEVFMSIFSFYPQEKLGHHTLFSSIYTLHPANPIGEIISSLNQGLPVKKLGISKPEEVEALLMRCILFNQAGITQLNLTGLEITDGILTLLFVLTNLKQLSLGTYKPSENDTDILLKIAQRQAKFGNIEVASQIVNSFQDSDGATKTVYVIAKKQAQLGDIEGAKKTSKSLRSQIYKERVLCEIIKNQAQSGDIEGAIKTASSIHNSGGKEGVLCEIAITLAQNDIKAAIEFAHSLDLGYQAIVLCEIGKIQEASGDIKGAKSTLSLAKEVVDFIQNQSTKVKVLSKFASLHAQSDIISVLEMAKSIEDPACKAVLLAEVGRIQCLCKDFQGGEKSFSLALQTAKSIRHNALVLSRIAQIQLKAGTTILAKQTAQLINDSNYLPGVLRDIAKMQAQSWDIEGAFKTLNSQKLYSDQDYLSRARSLCEIGKIQVESDDLEEARETLSVAINNANFVANEFYQSSCLCEIAKVQALSGDIEGAKKTADSMYPHHKVETICEIGKTQAISKDIEGARSTLSLAKQTVNSMAKSSFKVEALCHLAKFINLYVDLVNNFN